MGRDLAERRDELTTETQQTTQEQRTTQDGAKQSDDERVEQLKRAAQFDRTTVKQTIEFPERIFTVFGKKVKVKFALELTPNGSTRTMADDTGAQVQVDKAGVFKPELKSSTTVGKDNLKAKAAGAFSVAAFTAQGSFQIFGQSVPIDFKFLEGKSNLGDSEKGRSALADMAHIVEGDFVKISTGLMIPPQELNGATGIFAKIEFSLPISEVFSPRDAALLKQTSEQMKELSELVKKGTSSLDDLAKAADGRTARFKKLALSKENVQRVKDLLEDLRSMRNKLGRSRAADLGSKAARKVVDKMLKSKLMQSAARLTLAASKVLSRAIPILGWIMLAYDLVEIGFYAYNIFTGKFLYDPEGQGDPAPTLFEAVTGGGETTPQNENASTDGQKTEGQKTDGQKTDGQKTDGQKTDDQSTDRQTTNGQTNGQTTTGRTTDGSSLDEGLRARLMDPASPAARLVKILAQQYGQRVSQETLVRLFELVGRNPVTAAHLRYIERRLEQKRFNPDDLVANIEEILKRPADKLDDKIPGTKKESTKERTKPATTTEQSVQNPTTTDEQTTTEKATTEKTTTETAATEKTTTEKATTEEATTDTTTTETTDERTTDQTSESGKGNGDGTTTGDGTGEGDQKFGDGLGLADVPPARFWTGPLHFGPFEKWSRSRFLQWKLEAIQLAESDPLALLPFLERFGIGSVDEVLWIEASLQRREAAQTKQSTTTRTPQNSSETGDSTGDQAETEQRGDGLGGGGGEAQIMEERVVSDGTKKRSTTNGDTDSEGGGLVAREWKGSVGSETVSFTYSFSFGKIYPPDVPPGMPITLGITTARSTKPVALRARVVSARRDGMFEASTGIEWLVIKFKTANTKPVNVSTSDEQPCIVAPGLELETRIKWSPNWSNKKGND